MIRNIAVIIISSLLLSGCQHAVNNTPATDNQREQLSSLVGASQFLREQCNRADIPANAKLATAALKEAEKKNGSPTMSHTQLLEAAKVVATQLNADATPLQQKCSALNRSLAPFLSQIS